MASALVLIMALVGGFIQSVTGFGGGIIMMMVFPSLMPLATAAGVSGSLGLPLSLALVARYYKYVNWKKCVVPVASYMIMSAIAINISRTADVHMLKMFFGIFLCILSIYFAFFSDKVQLKGTIAVAILCGGISGLCGGFFGIGGPPLALYYLAVTETKEEYLGQINLHFATTNLYQTVLRIQAGILTAGSLVFFLFGCVGILTGRTLGSRFVSKIDAKLLKKIIYAFMAFSGIISILT